MPKKRNIDDHNKLPKYVYIRRGWYIYRQHLGNGKFAKDIKLCPATAKLSELHRKYESLTCTAAPEKNIDWLINQYLTSKQHKEKSIKTQKEYEKCAHIISTTKAGKSGTLFGQIHIDRITPGVIRKYIDAREKPVSANREIAFLSICFSWAVERDQAKTNPCKEVRRNSEKARTRYVTDDEYNQVYAIAAPWPHVQCAMELAYLCRMRTCEVLDLKKNNIRM
jgi:integrase